MNEIARKNATAFILESCAISAFGGLIMYLIALSGGGITLLVVGLGISISITYVLFHHVGKTVDAKLNMEN